MEKIVYIKNIFENVWGKDAYPSSEPPGSVPSHKLRNYQKSQANFSHLALLILFVFTERQSQGGGGHGTMPPLPRNTVLLRKKF